LDAKSDLQKNRTEPAVFFQNRTETEPNPRFLSKPNRNRTELEKSIPHIPNFNSSADLPLSRFVHFDGRSAMIVTPNERKTEAVVFVSISVLLRLAFYTSDKTGEFNVLCDSYMLYTDC